jgi:hypothetical protein
MSVAGAASDGARGATNSTVVPLLFEAGLNRRQKSAPEIDFGPVCSQNVEKLAPLRKGRTVSPA